MLSSFEVVSFRLVLLISLSKTAALLLLDSSLFLCLFKRSQWKLGLDRAGHMEWIRTRALQMCFWGSVGEGKDPKRNSWKGSHDEKKKPRKRKKKYTFLKSEFRAFISCLLKEIITEMELATPARSRRDPLWSCFMDREMSFGESSLLSVCYPYTARKWVSKL